VSLWYESLGQSLYDCEEDAEQRAKCILEHLSMDVPRFWRERALAGCRKTAPEAAIQRCASLQCSHMLEYAALVASPRAFPDGLSLVFQHPVGEKNGS